MHTFHKYFASLKLGLVDNERSALLILKMLLPDIERKAEPAASALDRL